MRSKQLHWMMAAAMLPLVVSCNWLTPLVFIGEHKKKILPEFDKLAHKRVAIVVWTKPSTLFDYPHARFEVATYIGDKLHSEMAHRELNVDVVDPRDVEDYLQKHPAAQLDPTRVGKAFDTDYVVYLEVLEFQFRPPQQPQFVQGKINVSVAVYDMRTDPDGIERYELTEVRCLHPEAAPALMSGTNEPLVREGTYLKLAELVARKFYEHTVDL